MIDLLCYGEQALNSVIVGHPGALGRGVTTLGITGLFSYLMLRSERRNLSS